MDEHILWKHTSRLPSNSVYDYHSHDWHTFALVTVRLVEVEIDSFLERDLKRRRHYSRIGRQVPPQPVVNTHLIIPIRWLWSGGMMVVNQPMPSLQKGWPIIQALVSELYPNYNFQFSPEPTRVFKIPTVNREFRESIPAFWVKIDTKRPAELGLRIRWPPQQPNKTEPNGAKRAIKQPLLNNNMEDHVIGCLMGQAVGDALGTRYEFSSADAARKAVRCDTNENDHLPILGGGPFRLIPGQVTDDTELALVIARRIPGISKVSCFYIAKGFVDWYHSGPFDIGQTTARAFSGIDRNLPVEAIHGKMRRKSEDYNKNSLSNGCLMRTSPIALMGIDGTFTDNEVLVFAGQVCALTNSSPVAIDATRVYVLAIRNALRGASPKEIWNKSYSAASTVLVQRILDAARSAPAPAPVEEGRLPAETDGSMQGYLGVALQLSFWELLHGDSFEKSLVRIVSRGGDTDTNACIAGALLGAYYGYASIPTDWSRTILTVKNPRRAQLPEVQTDDLLSLALDLARWSRDD